MKVSRYYMIFVLFLLTSLVYGQSGYFVAKDYLIDKYKDSIISFLINKQQFGINKTQFKTSDYEGSIYVTKHLELFIDSTENVLLAQFGSLGNDREVYWALFTSERVFFFRKMYDIEFRTFTKQYNSKAVAVIMAYIKLTHRDSVRKRHSASRVVVDEKTGVNTRVSL